VAALSAALSSRIPVDRVLRELSYVLPDDAWLTGLVANAPKEEDPAAAPQAGGARAPAGAGTAGVTIQGATFSHDSVARVLARLSLLPSLENVRLTASARIEPQSSAGGGDGKSKPRKQRPLVTFTIAADLRSGAQR
jgi:Tfp pilus assembly protein PilN